MMAASAGATRVIVVERNRFCYRAAKQCVRSNRERLGDAFDRITLLDQKLETCRLKGDDAPLELDETAGDDAGALPPPPLATIDAPADVFLTDLFDHNAGLGLGVLRAIDHARDRGLVTPDAVCVPGSITVNAALLSLRMETVSGFDVSSLNAYRWHPQAARLLELAREPHLLLSDVFEVTRVDLTRRLREKEKDKEDDEEEEEEGKKKKNSGGGKAAWEDDFEVRVPVVADGAFNAVAFWFECDLGGGEVLRSVAPPWGGTGTGTVEGGGDDQEPAATKKRSDDTRYFDADSFGVAVQYLDETFVDASETISLRVRRDKDQVFFTSTPPPTRPRHAHIPQWHYDMLHDAGRNEAYDAAIKTAVTATKRRLGGRCEVLDCGSGSGLLSMMAARAGRDARHRGGARRAHDGRGRGERLRERLRGRHHVREPRHAVHVHVSEPGFGAKVWSQAGRRQAGDGTARGSHGVRGLRQRSHRRGRVARARVRAASAADDGRGARAREGDDLLPADRDALRRALRRTQRRRRRGERRLRRYDFFVRHYEYDDHDVRHVAGEPVAVAQRLRGHQPRAREAREAVDAARAPRRGVFVRLQSRHPRRR